MATKSTTQPVETLPALYVAGLDTAEQFSYYTKLYNGPVVADVTLRQQPAFLGRRAHYTLLVGAYNSNSRPLGERQKVVATAMKRLVKQQIVAALEARGWQYLSTDTGAERWLAPWQQ